MSIRLFLAVLFLVIGCIWTFRRPFIGVLIIIILFHLNLRVFGTGLEDIRFQYYATIVLLISYVINRKQLEEQQSAPVQLPIKFMFAFLAVCFATSAWAVMDSDLAFESSVDFAKIILFSYLMMKIVRSEKDMQILAWVAIGSVWYTAFMARWGEQWGWISDNEIGIATGGTGTHMMMFFPLILVMTIWGSKWEKIAAYLSIPFILDGLTVLPEGSRSSFLNLITASIAFFLLAPKTMRKRSLLPFVVGAVLFISVLAPPGYFDYMKTILNPSSEGSAASRSTINHASLQIFIEHPMGIGYNNYSTISMNYMPEEVLTDFGTRDAHNSYLKVLIEFGFLGFIFWAAIFISAWFFFRRVRKSIRPDEPPTRIQLYAFAFAAGLIGMTTAIYTHNYNDLDTLYWFASFSCILYNLQFPAGAKPEGSETGNLEIGKPAPAEAPVATVTNV